MKILLEGDFKNKVVLVRCDFNVGLTASGEIADDFRIVKTLPTIQHLAEQGARIVLMSHLEKKGKLVSLKVVGKRLEQLLEKKVKFLGDFFGSAVSQDIRKMQPGDVALMENLRFHPEEKANDDNFAQGIAKLGEIYVNEAFACSHRAHASIAAVPRYMPSYAGLLLEAEITNLTRILEKPEHPFIVVIGGAKAGTKIKAVINISKVADHILFGSKIGEAILVQKQQLVGRGLPEPIDEISQIDITSPKMHLPVDGVMALADLSEGYLRKGAIGSMRREEEIYDIGPETIRFFRQMIRDAKTIFFNGPVGMYENKEFMAGTRELLDAISKSHAAYRVAGGGETLEVIHALGLADSFDFLSTGGGAMLEFLAGDKLPGIEALG